MDFFAAQDRARRTSRWLVGWFAAAVVAIVLVIYLALAFVLGLGESRPPGAPPPSLWQPDLFLTSAAGIGGFILLGSLYKIIALARGGGAAVAEALGGRLVARDSHDPLERRLINVVDEMAIAAGLPAPPVYLLDAEQGINAFAAGSGTTEAVVAVTRGALEALSRDELQGVIAHEFSHILNGDMRLNLRLMGVLHGILLLTLIGRILLRGARGSDKGAAPLVLMGLVLMVVGYIGVLFGNIIKAAVSRQREYLADAAAVQFTRNPSGIAGALKRIAGYGSEIRHPRAEETSHMFFGSGLALSRLFATHPPIEERIRRIDPNFEPDKIQPAAPLSDPAEVDDGSGMADGTLVAGFAGPAAGPQRLSAEGLAATAGTVLPAHMNYARDLLAALPPALHEAAHRPGDAQALVFALLLSADAGIAHKQLDQVRAAHGPALAERSAALRAAVVTAGAALRLPLLDLALPTLKELSLEARRTLLTTADALVRADGRVSLFEYALQHLLRVVLQGRRNGPRVAALATPTRLKEDCGVLFSLLARVGHRTECDVEAAFSRAAGLAPLDGPYCLLSAADLGPARIDAALERLAVSSPPFRKRLLEACAAAVLHDGQVAPQEYELLRTIGEALDCPLPPLPPLSAD
ncbi:M48 family metallopeptidase [Pseudothauera hydrothermalis]|uniref:M48 family metallopeptidase n=1 Tax=Pseudothauera hydrothermalis TaxID=2184083 RepID=UPI000E092972|nr:M48 family metallopeptidase [Pseudothauera hydrothermalis]